MYDLQQILRRLKSLSIVNDTGYPYTISSTRLFNPAVYRGGPSIIAARDMFLRRIRVYREIEVERHFKA